MRWLSIPLCSVVAFVVAYLWGAPFGFVTEPGIPNMNPMHWWGEDTGWMMGLPNWGHWLAVLPFAVLTVANVAARFLRSPCVPRNELS